MSAFIPQNYVPLIFYILISFNACKSYPLNSEVLLYIFISIDTAKHSATTTINDHLCTLSMGSIRGSVKKFSACP